MRSAATSTPRCRPPRATRSRRVDDKAMELASADAELKAALFRFVDVVPACRNLDDLARHLTGFLGEVSDAAAADRRRDEDGQLASRAGWRSGAPPPPASSTWRTASSSASRRPRRWATCADLWKDGVASTVDLLGEATVTTRPRPSATPSAAARRSTRSSPRDRAAGRRGRCWRRDGLGPLPRANLSVKVSALTPLLRADAPERGQRDAAGRLRDAAAPGPRPRRAPAHRHGVAGLARRRHRADPRPARRGRVRRRPVAPASSCRPTCATRPTPPR